MFAPVVLWSPTAAAFVNDSFVGMLVIALAMAVTAAAITVLSVPRGRIRDAYGDWELLTR